MSHKIESTLLAAFRDLPKSMKAVLAAPAVLTPPTVICQPAHLSPKADDVYEGLLSRRHQTDPGRGTKVTVHVQQGEGVAAIAGRLAAQAGFPDLDYKSRLTLATRLGLSNQAEGTPVSASVEAIRNALNVQPGVDAQPGWAVIPTMETRNSAAPRKTWTLAVGVNNYQDPQISPLKVAVRDATVVDSLFNLNRVTGGIHETVLLNDEGATRENIIQNFKDIARKASRDDRVVFSFSGHGVNSSLLTSDSEKYGFEGLTVWDLQDMLSQCNAKQKLVIIDACMAESMLPKDARKITYSFDVHSGTVFLVASQEHQVAKEDRGQLKQGVFTYYVTQGLVGHADADGNKVITVEELFNYASANVSSHTAGAQTPVLWGTFNPQMPVAKVE